MLVMVVFFIAFRWIHLSTPLIRLFLLVLILLLMPTLNFLPVWFALSLLRFRLPSRLPMMFIDRKSGSAGMPRPISYAVFCLKKKKTRVSLNLYSNQSLYFGSSHLLSACCISCMGILLLCPHLYIPAPACRTAAHTQSLQHRPTLSASAF